MSVASFWIAVAIMALLAALLIVWPLLRRAPVEDDAQRHARRAENVRAYRERKAELDTARAEGGLAEEAYASAMLELDRRLLGDAAEVESDPHGSRSGGVLLLATAIVLPLLALLLYFEVGAYPEVELAAKLEGLAAPMTPAERVDYLAALRPMLEKQAMKRDPEGNYRFLLARIDSSEGDHAAAARLYIDLAAQYPDDAELAAQAAQSLYLAAGGQVTAAVQEFADRVLAIDPQHAGIHGMLGMAGFQRGDYAAAIRHWQVLLEELPAESAETTLIRDGIAAARARLADAEAAQAPTEDSASP